MAFPKFTGITFIAAGLLESDMKNKEDFQREDVPGERAEFIGRMKVLPTITRNVRKAIGTYCYLNLLNLLLEISLWGLGN